VTCKDGDTTGATQLNSLAPDASGVAHPSTSETNLAPGNYNFMAVVAGNTNYTGKTGVCEPFTVDKASLGISTTVHNNAGDVPLVGNLPLGGGAHDSATVTGKASGFDLPNVTFYFFDKGVTCTNGDITGGTQLNTLAPNQTTGVAHPSTSETNLAPGNYNFMAVVAGNSNYTGATGNCEPFTVNKASLGINTTVHSDTPDQALVGNLPLNGGAHDSAAVTGKVSGFDLPNVTFYFFDKGVTCTNGDTTGGTQLNTMAPNQTTGVAHPSTSETNLAPGNYNFMAVVAGNTNYTGATGNCEPFTVNKGTPTIHTTLKNAANDSTINNGTALTGFPSVYDTSALSGQVGSFSFDTTATVTYRFFTNSACSGTPFDTDQQSVIPPSTVPKSKTEGPLIPGSYAFQAYYSGNANYAAATSECEPFSVVLNTLTPGYWKNHLANSSSKGPWYTTDCKTVGKSGGSCSTNGPWAIQYLATMSLGNFPVPNIGTAAQVFQAMNCSISGDQNAIGCLAGHLLAAKLNLANGTYGYPCILQAVADADAFLKAQIVQGVTGITYVGPSGKYTLNAAQRALAVKLKTTLDNYNNGSVVC
jgi:hypothetical protein